MGQQQEFDRQRTSGAVAADVISYLTMRKWIGYLSFLLPWVVVIGGHLFGAYPTKDSISGYYYSNMRDVFVGALCMVGVFLFSYKGFSDLDDVITNVCGLLAICVALFPTRPDDGVAANVGLLQLNDFVSSVVHYICAALLFLLLAFISMFLFTR